MTSAGTCQKSSLGGGWPNDLGGGKCWCDWRKTGKFYLYLPRGWKILPTTETSLVSTQQQGHIEDVKLRTGVSGTENLYQEVGALLLIRGVQPATGSTGQEPDPGRVKFSGLGAREGVGSPPMTQAAPTDLQMCVGTLGGGVQLGAGGQLQGLGKTLSRPLPVVPESRGTATCPPRWPCSAPPLLLPTSGLCPLWAPLKCPLLCFSCDSALPGVPTSCSRAGLGFPRLGIFSAQRGVRLGAGSAP